MECYELLHSKVMECFIKVKFGYDYLRETGVNRKHWLDCRMAKWNLVGKCSDDGTLLQIIIMGAHKATRI
jgi:hypothetical protein